MKYGTIIPLIGGMSLGNEAAFGNKPDWFLSYGDFAKNEESLYSYWPDVNKTVLNEKDPLPEDFVASALNTQVISAVPPCAGLSMLNTGGNVNENMGKGSDAIQNRWMYKAAEIALDELKPKVFFAENAPGLYSKMGAGVAQRLYQMARERGYSFTIYKTSTHFHGIPQRRMRTFFFFWDNDTAPLMSWYRRDMPTLEEYLSEVPEESSLNDVYFEDLNENIGYVWMKEKFGDKWKDEIKKHGGGTLYKYFERQGLLQDLLDYSIERGSERGERYFKHLIKKLGEGKGYWDSSPNIFTEYTNAVITKNVVNSVHPTEDRYMNMREYMHLMGLPHDYTVNEKRMQAVTQNVPVCTARDMSLEIAKYINGELEDSGCHWIKQDNNTMTNEPVMAKKKSNPLF